MPLIMDGVTIDNVVMDGVSINTLNMDGVEVWSRGNTSFSFNGASGTDQVELVIIRTSDTFTVYQNTLLVGDSINNLNIMLPAGVGYSYIINGNDSYIIEMSGMASGNVTEHYGTTWAFTPNTSGNVISSGSI